MAKGLKTGGRKKGTTNLVSGTTKEMITQIITKELTRLPALFDLMEPKEKVDCIIKLLPYIMPKIAPTEAPKIPVQNRGIPAHKLFAMQFDQRQLEKKKSLGYE